MCSEAGDGSQNVVLRSQEVVPASAPPGKCKVWGFPSGPVVKNPPVTARDMGPIPDPGEAHMLGATKPVCRNHRAHVLQLLRPTCPGACALQQEELPQ